MPENVFERAIAGAGRLSADSVAEVRAGIDPTTAEPLQSAAPG